jgi:hypothetical protein
MAIYTGFDPEKFQEKRTAIIDGDGFAWAIGWINREAMFNKQVTDSVNSCIHDILQGTQSEHYIGVLSPNSDQPLTEDHEFYDHDINVDEEQLRPAIPNFRKAIAKSRPYKGNRPERPEWYLKWCPVIEDHLETEWGFIRTPEGYEADDMVATFMVYFNSVLAEVPGEAWCCGNDKDLLQIPGKHFNVVKKTVTELDWYQCSYKLWTQALMGDSTDGIEGIPGMGPKGAAKILDSLTLQDLSEGRTFRAATLHAYADKFGEDIGIQKFYETYMLVKLRTDVPTEQFDLQEICKGYDLTKYEIQFHEENHRPDEPEEPIPDFSITE